jgi:hypothetical protein
LIEQIRHNPSLFITRSRVDEMLEFGGAHENSLMEI